MLKTDATLSYMLFKHMLAYLHCVYVQEQHEATTQLSNNVTALPWLS